MGRSKKKLYQKFSKLPKTIQNKFENLFLKQNTIVDEKYKLAEKYIIPVVMDRFLMEYNKVRDKEISLEKDIASFAEQHGFTFKQFSELRVQLLKERYDAFMKKRGIEV